jgi:serine/threonine-protein kinase
MDALLAALRKDPSAAWRKAAAFVITTIALVTAIVVSGLAIHARRTAARQAEMAREFGQEEAQIATMARMAALLPLHDLRPEMADIRTRMAAIEAKMREVGSASTGPGHYALGCGYIALEQWDDAARELEAAWSAGYREPEVASSLGLAYGKLYQKALSNLIRTDDQAANLAVRDGIARTYRDPAVRYLTEAKGRGGVRSAEVLEGLIALYEGRFDEALVLARRASSRSASLFESRTLEGDIETAIAYDAHWNADDRGSAFALERAGVAYRAALEIARSSADALQGECARLVELAWRLNDDRKSPDAVVKEALVACSAARTARPDDARLVALEARAWDALLYDEAFHGADVEATFAQVKDRVDASLRIDPRQVTALQVLANAYLDVSDAKRLHGLDSRPATEQAIVTARRALAIDPANFALFSTLGYALESKGKEEIKHGLRPEASFAAQAECAEELRRQFPRSAVGFHLLESAHLVLGQWQRDHGISPEKELQEGLRTCEEERALDPRTSGVATGVCYGEWLYGTHLLRVGDDPRPHLEHAMEECNRAIALAPGDWVPHLDLGVSASTLANWQLANGVDPAPAIDQARTALARAFAIDQNHLTSRYITELEITAARVAIARGDDPTRAFGAAEMTVRKLLTSDHDDADALRALATLERFRADWLLRAGRPAEASLRDGLTAVDQAEALTPDVAESFATEGALHLLAARAARASERVRHATLAHATLTRALEMNAFLAHDYRPLLDEAASLSSSTAP